MPSDMEHRLHPWFYREADWNIPQGKWNSKHVTMYKHIPYNMLQTDKYYFGMKPIAHLDICTYRLKMFWNVKCVFYAAA